MHNGLKKWFWITLTLLIFLGLTYSCMRGIILPSFALLEKQELAEDAERCSNVLASELQQLAVTAGDYAGWDEAYSFVQTGRSDFIKTNTNPAIFSKLRLNLLVYTNKEGEIVFGKHVDWRSGAVRPISPALRTHLFPGSKLLTYSDDKLNKVSGLLRLPEGIMLITSHPVMTSDYQGPVMGALVIGRYLDEPEVSELAKRVNLPMTVTVNLPAPTDTNSKTAPNDDRIRIISTDADTIVGSLPLSDIYGAPVGALHLTETRRIYQQGMIAVNTYFLITALITTLIAILIAIFIRKLSQTEQLLRESEFRWKFAIEGSGDGVWDWDIQTDKTKYTNRWKVMLGYSEDDILPANHLWEDLIHPDDKPSVEEAMQTYLNGNAESYVVECRLRCKDESYKWILDRGMVVSRSENGTPLRMIGTHTDITERKRAEEEKLTIEKQYQQTQRLESLGVLAGGIAHDFNNILQIIIGYCSLTKQKPETAEDYIPQIEKAAKRAAGLCRQMMSYAGNTKIVMTHVNMWILVDEMTKMLKSTINQNVEIKPHLSSETIFIKADASQLRQIVMNLIINASEAIGDAQGEIGVSLAKKVIESVPPVKDHLGKTIPAGLYACLEVTDNGCGMNDETKRRIFEPFYTTKFAGRGLGMSAVLGIITAHGGALQFSSQPGQGTTFKIYLPIQIDQLAAVGSNLQVASAAWRGRGTILLVEDEEHIKAAAKTMMQELGFTVIEASNGKEALELFKKNRADITMVLADMGLPVMDGYTLFRELKKLDSKLPIIVSSGFGETDVTSRIAREDIAWLVSKPYNFDQLREALKSVVDGAQPKSNGI